MNNNLLIESQDGSHTLSSSKFGVTYHSIYGAVHESITVFLSAGLQYQILNGKKEISVFEMGLGTGLNAFLTLIESERNKIPIEYTAIEKYPISYKTALELNYVEQLDKKDFLDCFRAMHSTPYSKSVKLSPYFTFNKILDDLTTFESFDKYDVIYYDAFAPNAQEELWTDTVMKKMYSLLNIGGVLVSYCAKGSFKRSLKTAGFNVEAIPGPPGKKEK